MQELELEGMTLAELRRVNTQLDTERLTEREALRTEYLNLQAEFHDRKEAEETEHERRKSAAYDNHHVAMDALEAAYKRLGVHIGQLMDERKFCGSVEETERLRKEIEKDMDERAELRRQRRELNTALRNQLIALRDEFSELRKVRYDLLSARERDIRQARIAIEDKYYALHEQVRKHIAVRLKEKSAEPGGETQ